MAELQPRRQPQEQPGQKPPRKGIAKILGRGQRNPFGNMTPTDAKPTPGYSPLTGTDRASADSLHQIAAEARARVEANSAETLADAEDTIDNSSPTSGFWDRRVSKKAAVIAGSVIALVGAAGLGAEAVVVNNNSSTDKANTTDAGDSANPTPPSLTTPDGKTVVVPGVGGSSATSEASKSATAVTTPVATEQPQPTTTPTKEAIAEVPCQIVPEQYCQSAEKVVVENKENGTEFTYIKLTLPPGTEISSPISGQLAKGSAVAPFSGSYAIVRPPSITNPAAIFDGDIEFDNMLNVVVTQGSFIGKSKGSGVIYFTINNAGPQTNVEDLKSLFPEAFKNGISGTFSTVPGQNSVTYYFAPK